MQKYQTLIGFALLSAAVIAAAFILSEAIGDHALSLVRVLQL